MEFKAGLEGVVAFETEIAEPDKEGGALRYRGVDIDELVGRVPYEKVWGLLVDGDPLANIAILQDPARMLAIMKDGQFHKEPDIRSARSLRPASVA